MVLAGIGLLIVGIAIGAALGHWFPPERGAEKRETTAPSPERAKITEPAEAVDPGRVGTAQAERTPIAMARPQPERQREPLRRVAVRSGSAGRSDDLDAGPDETYAASIPAWRRHAALAVLPEGRPLIAIVIDDLGVNRAGTARAVNLPGPLTLAFLPYAESLPAQTARARAAGHELLVHQPMEPISADEDPGPYALLTDQDETEILRRLRWGLDRFEGYVGINNHMGSRFTTWAPGMRAVMGELGARGLLFLDSRTIANSIGEAMANNAGVPNLRRHVFLDNERDIQAIEAQLRLTEEIARREGYAIAIGHPTEATLTTLERWLPAVAERGLTLAPITALVARELWSLRPPPDPRPQGARE